MSEAFPRIRSFAFVDGVDEVTDLLGDPAAPLDAPSLLARANVVRADGHSDYGAVLERFWNTHGRAGLGPKTTLIITGDARNNYRAAGAGALRSMSERARRVYWLNPEPRADWDTTDSIMGEYAPCCDGVFEVRNLRQLASFVGAWPAIPDFAFSIVANQRVARGRLTLLGGLGTLSAAQRDRSPARVRTPPQEETE